MPRLWTQTIEQHRRQVREAILDAAATLAIRHGRRSVTMSRVAEEAGIGRATLYKYFADADAILLAWHERQVAAHVQQLLDAAGRETTPGDRLRAVLEAYSRILFESRRGHDPELAAFLHAGQHVATAHDALRGLLRQVVTEAASVGEVRRDVPPDDLVAYCLHALGAAGDLGPSDGTERLVGVVLAGLRPPRASDPARSFAPGAGALFDRPWPGPGNSDG